MGNSDHGSRYMRVGRDDGELDHGTTYMIVGGDDANCVGGARNLDKLRSRNAARGDGVVGECAARPCFRHPVERRQETVPGVDVRLHGKGNPKSHGARPVYQNHLDD